jgi:hypothetical protein
LKRRAARDRRTPSRTARRKPPPTRRSFEGPWDEIAYLFAKVQYWHDRGNLANARRYVPRLKALVQSEEDWHLATLGQEAWSYIAELRGDLCSASLTLQAAMDSIISHFERNPDPGETGTEALMEKFRAPLYRRLAELYLRQNQPYGALVTLRRAAALCTQMGYAFEATALLRKLERAAGRKPRSEAGRRRRIPWSR